MCVVVLVLDGRQRLVSADTGCHED